MNDIPDHIHSSLLLVFRRVLRPLTKLALAKRIPVQVIIDQLKKISVAVCQEEFGLTNKRLTDSRISVLTGLQRKDIKAIRLSNDSEENLPSGAGPLPRLVAHWRSAPGYQDAAGLPLTLPKIGPNPSFEFLVRMISHDIHPRTLLDDLVALEYVEADRSEVKLSVDAFIPRADEGELSRYLANNLGDHTTAAVVNVLTAPATAPYFERAVHYNHLSAESLENLDALSRRLQQQTLEKINAHALALQIKDQGNQSAVGRFRCGAFVYYQSPADQASKEPNE